MKWSGKGPASDKGTESSAKMRQLTEAWNTQLMALSRSLAIEVCLPERGEMDFMDLSVRKCPADHPADKNVLYSNNKEKGSSF